MASVLHPKAQLPHRPCDIDGGSIDGGVMGGDSVSMSVDQVGSCWGIGRNGGGRHQ